ncbi:related to DNA mismatch repair protein HSM3 [Zygosaccharomyces bailii ISA1307]|nr:related to DNA mismatch repair protein HSM3 [Zygosaccharomyces bailii ISA1307]
MSAEAYSHTRELFDELNNAFESNELPMNINGLLEKSTLDLSTQTSLQEDPKRLLANIKRILVENLSESPLDHNLLLQLLNSIISICSFEDVLATFSIEDLEEALNSGISPLIEAACKVIAKSYPKGIFANSVLCDILLKLYFDPNGDISIITDVEKTIATLSSDELIRRRILINNVSLLMAIRKQFEPISMARLLELLNIEAGFMSNGEFDEKLFIIRSEEIYKSLEMDIIMFIHITTFYCKLLEEILFQDRSHNHPNQWLLKHILPILPTFGLIYEKRAQYADVKYFARSYLFNLFRKVSYLDDENIFSSLDDNYIHISRENEYISDLLSFVNPKYVYEKHQNLLLEFSTIMPSHLGILRNFVADEDCFLLVKSNLTSTAILAMPYMEQMVLLQRMSQFAHCVRYLLDLLPKVMSGLLYGENGEITETECATLRRETFENLLKFDKDVLNVWYEPLREEYKKVSYGGTSNEVQATLASTYL